MNVTKISNIADTIGNKVINNHIKARKDVNKSVFIKAFNILFNIFPPY